MRLRRISAALLACSLLLPLAGCGLTWSQVRDAITASVPPAKPPAPPAEPGQIIVAGWQDCRTLAVPAAVEFTMTGKQPGHESREEVTIWAFEAGAEWYGGNPPEGSGIFTVRCNDSRPDWAKLKVYSHGGEWTGKEPPLRVVWVPAESYRQRLAIAPGRVTWTARRLPDGAPVSAVQDAATPERVTICIGDPGSRKAAVGATLTGITWSGMP